ncbi:MAG: GNAT family N-acetyltransferase [Candidatus Izemoplasmatales bacterium]
MELRIEVLSSHNKESFFSLFNESSFQHQQNWSSCYCRFYHTTCSRDEWMNRTGAFNKQEASQEIDQGLMKGFLAFDGDICVGWLNSAPISLYHRLYPIIEDEFKKKKTALSICFVIRENYRGLKIASSLLDYAIAFHRFAGMETLIAVPIEAGKQEMNYRGPKDMYLHRHFKEYQAKDGTIYMVLDL